MGFPAATSSYAPRRTLECAPARVVREHLPGFLARLEAAGGAEGGGGLPSFVVDELRGFGTCGDFEQGFFVVACTGRCGDELRVPFSCKGRGVCPSCMGRRMCEGAALLVEHRLPAVRWRQWVLSFPGPVAVRLGYDRELLRLVCRSFADRVMQSLRWRVKRAHGCPSVRSLHPGVLVVVQRFKSDLGLFVHLHCLVSDGCFEAGRDGERPRFLAVAGLDERHLLGVLAAVRGDLADALDDEGEGGEPDEGLRACVDISARASARTLRLVDRGGVSPEKPLTVGGFGMQVHAATVVDGRDRPQLERLCRYMLRPPFAQDAVTELPDGRIRVRLKQPRRTGVRHVEMERDVFLARLAALVPPPRFNLVRYYGVLSNRHGLRPSILPPHRSDEPRQLELFERKGSVDVPRALGLDAREHRGIDEQRDPSPSRLGWATLLARVFAVDVRVCSKCGAAMRVQRVVTDPAKIAALLHGARPPPRPSPRGQIELFGR